MILGQLRMGARQAKNAPLNILCTRHIAQCRGWSTMEGQVSPIFMVAGRLTSKIIFYKGLPWTQTHTVYIQYWEGPIDKYMMYCIQIHQFTIHTVFNTLPLKMNGIFTNPNYQAHILPLKQIRTLLLIMIVDQEQITSLFTLQLNSSTVAGYSLWPWCAMFCWSSVLSCAMFSWTRFMHEPYCTS